MTATKNTNTARILDDLSTTTPVVEGAIPEDESKAETFARLTPLRVNNALDKIRIVGNLANRSQYEYTDAQVDKIEAALMWAVQDIMRKFRNVKIRNTFEL